MSYIIKPCICINFIIILYLNVKVINIYSILFVAAVSLGSAIFGLYHAWRISRNSQAMTKKKAIFQGKKTTTKKLQESAEKLDTSILPPGIFVLFAVLVFSALKPYLTSYALRYNIPFLFSTTGALGVITV